jgi:hypothetical protein
MRTGIVIGIGLAILAAGLWLWPTPYTIPLFLIAWLLFCVIDWYVGVYRRGYSAIEELRIHAVIFAVPLVAVWLFVIWVNARR